VTGQLNEPCPTSSADQTILAIEVQTDITTVMTIPKKWFVIAPLLKFSSVFVFAG